MSKRKIFKFEIGMYEEQVSLPVAQYKGLPEIAKMQNDQSLTEFKYA